MPDISAHSSDELRRELEKRQALEGWKSQNQPKVDAVITTLKAAIGCLENLPSGTIAEQQLNKAARLAYELAYMCLPGGSVHSTRDEGPVGMDAGWLLLKPKTVPMPDGRFGTGPAQAFRKWTDSVLTLVENRHANRVSNVPRLTMEESSDR